ncbi:hypothetical protein BG006_002165, partial [Podila minutissima]
ISIKQTLRGAFVHGEKNRNTQIVPANCPVADIDPKTTFCIQHTTLSDSNLSPDELLIKGSLRLARTGAWRRIAFQGPDCDKQYGKEIEDMSNWIREGKLKNRETVVHRIENAPNALMSLFKSDNTRKMLVKVRRGGEQVLLKL